MNNPAFLPTNKFDFDACAVLEKSSDQEIEPYLPQLITWLQDMNWPIAGLVTARLQKLGLELVPVVLDVLQGDDHIWKYWILSRLLPNVRPDVLEACLDEVIRIINQPTVGEKDEEVDLVALDIMVLYGNDPTFQ